MAEVKLILEGDGRNLEAVLDRTFKKIKELGHITDDLNEKTKKAAKSQDDLADALKRTGGSDFGKLGGAGISGGMAGGAIATAVGAAVASALRGTLEQIRNDLAGGAASLAKFDPGYKRLVQVSGSQAEFEQLRNITQGVAIKYGMETGAAQDLVFNARSLGELPNIEALAAASQFTDANAMALAAGKLKSAFGASEAGSTTQIINKLIAAAETSDIPIERLATAVLASGASGARMGATDEEVIAATSQLSKVFKSEEVGGTRLSAVLAAFAQKNVGGGKGLMAALSEYGGMSEAKKSGFTANKEFAEGIQAIMSNLPAIQETQGRLLSAQDFEGGLGPLLTQRLGLIQSDPQLRAQLVNRQAAAQLELTKSGTFGTEGLDWETKKMMDESGQMGDSDFGRWMGGLRRGDGFMGWGMRALTFMDRGLEDFDRNGFRQAGDAALQGALRGVSQKAVEANTAALERNTDAMNREQGRAPGQQPRAANTPN